MSGHISDRDFASYLDIFNSMIAFVQAPRFVDLFKSRHSQAGSAIQKRGRNFEYAIRLEYLRNLNEHYEKWIGSYKQSKLLIIDGDAMDFVGRV